MAFFGGNIFWFLMGIVFIAVAAGFKVLAEDQGWKMTWWKWLLAGAWYFIFFNMGFLVWGTFIGEGFASAGFKLFLLIFFITVVLGVGLWRVLLLGADKDAVAAKATE